MQLATIEGIRIETRISAAGRNLGQRMAFNDKGTPAQMREEFKRAGLKGNKLSAAVRDAVKSGKDIAWVRFQALAQMAQNGDFTPALGDINKAGTKIKLELVKSTEPKAKKASAPTVDVEAIAKAKAIEMVAQAMGTTPEEAEKYLARVK